MNQRLCLLCLLTITTTTAYSQKPTNNSLMGNETINLTCKLTTAELQQRKKTVIAELKSLVLERIETEKGARFKFEGSDKTIDLLTSFIKTERLCCSFFTFNLSVADEQSFAWLELSGPKGAKEFIETEIGF